MKTKILVSIILPTYNETESIFILIKRIKNVFKKLNNRYIYEIIIIDDNSPDLTGYKLKERYKKDKRIKIFIRKKIRGLGTAIGYGVKKATGSIIIGMDADGNHPPEKIPPMLAKLKNYDLIVGSRFIKGGGGEDWKRQYGSLVFNFLLRILGFPIWDNTSGFYAISRVKLGKLGLNKIYYGYGDYHLRLVYFAKLIGYKSCEVPVFYYKRLGGESKSKLAEMLIKYFKEALKLRLG